MARLLLTALLFFALAPARAAADDFIVIVHPDNPVAAVDRGFLRHAFLKKTTTWKHGETLAPVDLTRRYPARERFTRQVLGKTMAQLKRYWSQLIFSGKGVPPPEVDSEASVIAFVLSRRGAVGYLPAGTPPGRAKVVGIR